MTAKLVTVFGATGAQGSSVARSLQQNKSKSFAVRGITRDPASPSAKQIADVGVEVVKADGWDKDSLVAAFKGSWGVFVNTNSDDAVFERPDETRTELDLGMIIVDAAAAAGVHVFVYSGMASASVLTHGKVPVDAFDNKHAIGEYARSSGAFEAVVIVSAGWYFENFLVPDIAPIFGGFPFTPSEDGDLVFQAPKWGGEEDVPFIAVADDYGDIVHGVFLEPEKWAGRLDLVQAVSDILSLDRVTKVFEKATAKKSRFEAVPEWRDLEVYGIRALETVKRMFGFCQASGGRYYGVKTERGTAAELKRKGSEARAQTGKQTSLLSLEQFFKREFGGY